MRIAPAFWLCLTVSALLFSWHEVLSRNGWVHYAFAQIYFPDAGRRGLRIAWSLDTEISFYLMLPLFAVVLAVLTVRLRTVALLLAVALSIVVYFT